jgi:hypothetical protein
MVFDSTSVCFRHPGLSRKAIEFTVIRKNYLAALPVRLTPGALWLRFHQKFGHGVRVAWYRDVVRPRILKTPPVENTTDEQCEIHVLTSERDWLNLIWALKSFYFSCGRRYALCIHEDGSLKQFGLDSLRRHFPSSRIILRPEADGKLAKVLRAFPRSLEFRNSNLLAPKVFDFIAYLESDRMGLFDSDLLFFAEPAIYLQRVEDPAYRRNTFNTDCADAYTVGPDAVRARFDYQLVPRVNSGFGLVHRDSIRWEWLEEFLTLPGILDGHFWRIEQTLFALCSSRYGVEMLPDEYTLRLAPGVADRCFRHYNGAIRHLMYGEGLRRLVKGGFLDRQ